LHDRTADKISRAISVVPDAAATIVPYDVQSRIRQAFPDLFEQRLTRVVEGVRDRVAGGERKLVEGYEHPKPPAALLPIDGLIPGHIGTVQGRVMEVDELVKDGQAKRVAVVGDESGELRISFRRGGDDIVCGQLLRVTGKARRSGNRPVYMSDPSYEVVEQPRATTPEV
jgi:hypothetical protein